MKMTILAMAGVAALSVLTSCDKDLVTYEQGDIRVSVEAGEGWLHDFPLFMGIKKKNPPQMAIWTEDTNGNYLSTLYITERTANQSWRGGAKSRPSSLPVWTFAHVQGAIDGVSGATPKASFDMKLRPVGDLQRFVVKIEVNHSTDWNYSYPKDAAKGTPGWSGGTGGSGQPALVYAVEIDLTSPVKSYTATLVGHSSPDGSDGGIVTDTSSITSAMNIVKRITINIQ